jgi:hypothetical protein
MALDTDPWHVSLSTYSQYGAREPWIAPRYVQDQAKSLQDQVPWPGPFSNLMVVSQPTNL